MTKIPTGAQLAARKTPANIRSKGVTAPPPQVSVPELTPTEGAPVTQVVSREESIRRATVLDELMATSRRGAKKHLWVTRLGKQSQAYAGTLRKGTTMFKDELCREVEKVLELPENWFANPTIPPAHIAQWAIDPNVPMEGEPEKKKATQPKLRAYVKPGASAAHVEVKSAPDAPAVGVPTLVARRISRAAQKSAPPTPDQAQTVSPAPVTEPQAAQGGPLYQALVNTLRQRQQEGTFSEQDALKLLNVLYSV